MVIVAKGFPQDCGEKFYYAYDKKSYLCEVKNRFCIGWSATYSSAIRDILLQDKGTMLEWVNDSICIVQVNTSQNTIFRENIQSLPGIKFLHPIYTSSGGQGSEMGLTDEFVIKPKGDVPLEEIDKLHQKYQVTVKKVTDLYRLLSVPAHADALAIANAYQESGLVVYSHPSFLGKLAPDIPRPPIFDKTSSWTEITTNLMDETYCHIDSYELKGDTVFNHTLYTEVYLNGNLYAALRAENDKIVAYFYPIEEERLICDISEGIGRSACFEYYEQVEPLCHCFTTTEVDHLILLDGKPYAVATFDDTDNRLIHRIGFTHGFFKHIFPTPANGDQTRLLCLSKNGQLVYQNEQYKNCTSCDLASSVNEINGKKRVNLIHTPEGIIFDISNGNNGTLSLCLYNMAGQQIYSRQKLSRQTTINNLDRGYYFYKVTDGESVYLGKYSIK
jgi:hypothetical protein